MAMFRLASEPTDESTLEQLGIETIRLRAAVLTRDGNTRRVDDVSVYVACLVEGANLPRSSSARQVEAPTLTTVARKLA